MGAYTWTFVRIDKVNKEQVKSLVEHAIWSGQHTTYGEYSKLTEEEYIQKWIKFHKKEYDYFVNECGVSPDKMTDEYLTKEIKSKMKKWLYARKCYQKVLIGEMEFDEMLNKTHQLTERNFLHDFYIIKRKGNYFVNLNNEIFRNYEYGEEEFYTVDSLIKHLEDPKCNCICDFSALNENNVQPDYGPLTDALKNKIIEYYSAIGDGNFVVHFG